MVATRRGVRVYSPSKTNPDQCSDVQATPSAGRRTRSAAKQAESPTQHALAETSPPPSSLKRCTRASRLHSPEQPCTPVGSTHEGDMSDLESCCSAVSDIEAPMTRTRRGRRQPCTVSQEDEEISEVESCSSAVSASKARQSSRWSTRRRAIPESSDPVHVEAGDVKVDLALETESCSSVVSESQRVTRSQRKSARTRASAKRQTEDSELSDVDSCTSSVSGAKSTTRRATRSRRRTGPIPIHLDEASESSLSPAPSARSSRAGRGKAAADVSEPQSCESEGFESGPTYSITTRGRGKAQTTGPKAVDSDCELSDVQSPVGSPCSTRSKGTPCSSRTGSGSSSRGALASRRALKDFCIVLKRAGEPVMDTSLNDSRLESTVIAEDADCTLLEEDTDQTLEEEEGAKCIDLKQDEADTVTEEKGVHVISEEDLPASPLVSEEAVIKPAVTVRHQQEEPRAEMHEDTSEMGAMQETVPPDEEPMKLCQSVTVTLCQRTSEITEETGEKDEAIKVADSVNSSQGDEDAVVETWPSEEEEEEEKMEVSTLNREAQQVVDSSEDQVESIQVTSSQQHKITVDSGPEQQPKDVTVHSTNIISLLDSSEDEEESAEEEEGEVSGEEDHGAEERGGPSSKPESAGTSVEGLFMIDTRPGQQADEHYYKERPTEEEEQEEEASKKERVEQEEQDDEFMDEEGDDDDDEDANILFSSRNPQLKELSSRIDPGIRVKELGGLYINFDGSKSKPVSNSLQKLKEKKIQDEVMKKSVIGPDFEKKDAVPPYSESKAALKLKNRVERQKSTGDGWFNMKAPEITQELKGDLQVLKMRGSMDPKRFYKKNDRDGFPKYFQVGTVVDDAADFYHSRIPKKDRKRTMVEELLSDAEFRHNNKKKYQHILTEKAAHGAGKRNRKKNKFHKK